jgi:hypothetical protein
MHDEIEFLKKYSKAVFRANIQIFEEQYKKNKELDDFNVISDYVERRIIAISKEELKKSLIKMIESW